MDRAAAIPLPRLRLRRWKPPNAWTVLWAIMCVDFLALIAARIITLNKDPVEGSFFLAVDAFCFTIYWGRYRDAKRRDAQDTETTLAPPEPLWRWLAALMTAAAVRTWIRIFAGW